jgi:hypothetical protein
MNVEIGTETPIFLFWEYVFQIFGILSLQCEDTVSISNGGNNQKSASSRKKKICFTYGDDCLDTSAS